MANSRTITQGHPTYHEPDDNKGGQDGAPKPDGRTPRDPATPPPATQTGTITSADQPPGGARPRLGGTP